MSESKILASQTEESLYKPFSLSKDLNELLKESRDLLKEKLLIQDRIKDFKI